MTHRSDLVPSDAVTLAESDTATGNYVGFHVLTAGDVVVRTAAGNDRTFTFAAAGPTIPLAFTQFRTASTATIIAFIP